MLEGDIKDINLVERLIELWRERFTGAIRFENDGIIKIIYFKEGSILSASTNDRADSVDEILMRAGKVSKEHVKQALAKRKESETLGDALLNLGFITRKELTWARRIQVINVLRSIEQWGAGTYTIVADYLPKREEGTIYPLPQIIVEMVVTDSDRAKFERLLDSGAVVFEKAPGQEETFRGLGLNEDAEAVMAEVDGTRTASEVAAASRQETFNAFKLMHALSLLGIVQRAGAPAYAATPAATGFEGVGVADAADVWGTSEGSSMNFQLDDEPPSTMGGAFTASDDVASIPGLADPSAYSADASDLLAPPSPPPPAAEPERMPAWDMPPRGASPLSAPSPEPPAEPDEEPKWGFDEAQLEASRKAATFEVPPPVVPPRPTFELPKQPVASKEGTVTRRGRVNGDATTSRKPAPFSASAPVEKKSRYGLLIALMVLFIVAGISYFAFAWWTSREAAEVPQAVAPTRGGTVPAVRPRDVPPPVSTATEAATKTATRAPVTITPAPVPQPAIATTTTAPPPLSATPAPAKAPSATPATGDRARYDEMARNYAQNPGGNFTVQFAIVCEPSNVTRALRSSGGGAVWFVPIRLKERSCYRMFWGRFETREQADAAMTRMPGELRESEPAVVTVPR